MQANTSNKYFIGIDVGAKGGIAILRADGSIFDTHPMPYLDKAVNGNELASTLNPFIVSNSIIAIEHAHTMPKQGVTGAFNYGRGFGTIIGVIEALYLKYVLVRPKIWQKSMFIGTSSKSKPKERADAASRRIWPKHNFVLPRCRNKHDGMIDAALIAEWLRQKELR